MTIWHLALAADWERARATGSYAVSTLGATIADVGFLHASRDRAQADAVARRFYAEVTEPLLLLAIAEDRLAAHGLSVRWEAADPGPAGGAAEVFPHVYGGPLPVAVVRDATPYPRPH